MALSPAQVKRAREALRTVQQYLHGVRDDLSDQPTGKKAHAEFLQRVQVVEEWARWVEGEDYDRNHDWAMLLGSVRFARRSGGTHDWSHVPERYRATEAQRRALTQAAQAAKGKVWLDTVADLIRGTDGQGPRNGAVLEATVSRFLQIERRVKGVDAD